MGEWDNWVRPNQEHAIRMAVIGELPRVQAIDTLEAWYNGCAYSVGLYARPYAWDQEHDNGKRIPLEQRRPYQMNLAKQIVDASVSMLLGEEHWPDVEVEDDEDTETWVSVISEAINLPEVMLKAAKDGGKARSAVLVGKVFQGYLRAESLPAKYCKPTFGPDGKSLTHLLYQYKCKGDHLEELGYEGLDADKDYWYRREYTPDGEYYFLPVEVDGEGKPPVFTLDTARTVEHRLGVLCAVWIPNLPSDHPYDGQGTYEAVLELLHQVNVLFSMATRSIRKMSDPTLAYEGVQDAEDLPESQKIGSSSGGSVVSPGQVKILEMTGSGQEAALTWIDRLCTAIQQIARVVQHNPEKLAGGKLSGYALRILHGPLIELVGELRLTYGPALVRFIRLLLELVSKLPQGSVILPREVSGAINPKATITLKWGDYFAPTAEDIKAEIENLMALVASGLMSKESALAKVCQLYGIEDVAAEQDRIQAEKGQDPEHSMNEAIKALQMPVRGEMDNGHIEQMGAD